jgi:hypothetical protein
MIYHMYMSRHTDLYHEALADILISPESRGIKIFS